MTAPTPLTDAELELFRGIDFGIAQNAINSLMRTISHDRAKLAAVMESLRGVYRWFLVCESAVRWSDFGNHEGVTSAFQRVKAVLASPDAAAAEMLERLKRAEDAASLYRTVVARQYPDGQDMILLAGMPTYNELKERAEKAEAERDAAIEAAT